MLCRWMQIFKVGLVHINKFQLRTLSRPLSLSSHIPLQEILPYLLINKEGSSPKNLYLCVQNRPEQTMTVIRKYWKLIKL